MGYKNKQIMEILLMQQFNPVLLFVLSFCMIIGIGLIDFFTGIEVSVALLYLIPIGLVSWFINRNAGLVISLVASIDWFFTSIIDNHVYSHPGIPFWNALVELVFFSIISYTTSSVKVLLIRERAMARSDNLTGIANRRAFMEIVSQEFERSHRYHHAISLAYLDLDNFKMVNDRLGHDVGDQLLRTVVDIMKSHTRNSDLIARLGGDEFAILLPETDSLSAKVVLSKLQQTVKQEMSIRAWPVTMSIGLCSFQEPPKSITEALNRADQLMYRVKSQGKDSILQEVIMAES